MDQNDWTSDGHHFIKFQRKSIRRYRIGRNRRGAVRAGALALGLITVVSVVAAIQTNIARRNAMEMAHRNSDLAIEKGNLAVDLEKRAIEKEKLANQKGELAEKNAALVIEERNARSAEERQTSIAREKAQELKRALYLSDINRVEQYAKIGNIERMQTILARHVPKADEEDLRGFDWSYWWNYVNGDQLTLETNEPVQKVAVSPNGSTIAIAGSGGELQLVDSRTGELRSAGLTLPAETCAALRFTTDGEKIVSVGAQGTIKIWNVTTGGVIRDGATDLGAKPPAPVDVSRWPAAISADGTSILAHHPIHSVMALWSGSSCRFLTELSSGLYILPNSDNHGADSLVGQMRRFREPSRVSSAGTNIGNRVEKSPVDSPPVWNSDPSGMRTWILVGDESTPGMDEWGAPVFGLAIAPSKKRFADGDREGLVRIWNADTLLPEKSFAEHRGVVWDVAFSEDEHLVASAGNDGLVCVWDVASGRLVAHCRGSADPIRSVVFLNDSRQLAAAGDDGIVRIWEAQTSRLVRTCTGHTDRVNSLAVLGTESGNERRLVSGSSDGTVRIWEVDAPPNELTPRNPYPLVHAIAPPQGHWFAVVDGGGHVHIWDTETDRYHALLAPPPNTQSLSGIPNAIVGVSDNGSLLLISYINSLALWDVEAQKSVFEVDSTRLERPSERVPVPIRPQNAQNAYGNPLPKDLLFQSVDLSRDGKLIAAGCSDGTIRVWDVARQEVVWTWAYPKKAGTPPTPLTAVKFLPNGSGLVVVRSGTLAEVRFNRFQDGADRLIFKSPKISGIAVSPDGSRVAVIGSDGLQLISADSEIVTPRLVDACDAPTFAAFSPDGLSLATLSHRRMVRVWDVATRTEKHRWMAKVGPNAATFINGGNVLALPTSSGFVELWRPGDAEPAEPLSIPDGPVYRADLSNDGQFLLAAVRCNAEMGENRLISNVHIVLHDIAAGTQSLATDTSTKLSRPFASFLSDDSGIISNLGLNFWHDRQRSLERAQWTMLGTPTSEEKQPRVYIPLAATTHDGKTLAIVDETAGGIQIWERSKDTLGPEGFTRTTLLQNPVPEPVPLIADLAFSPDDDALAATNGDIVRVWDISRNSSFELTGHTGPVRAVAWSRDGTFLATASTDSTVRLWDVRERRERAVFREHEGGVNAVVFPTDGRTVISGGVDGTILVWDLDSGEVRLRLAAHTGSVHHLSFDVAHEVLVSAGEDGVVKFWRGASGHSRMVVPIAAVGGEENQPQEPAPAVPSTDPNPSTDPE